MTHARTLLALAAGLTLLAAALPAAAQTQDAPQGQDAQAAGASPPGPQGREPPAPPPLRCEFKVMHNCGAEGACKQGSDIPGVKLPLRVTVEFESGVVAAVDDTGWARPDRIDGLARSGDQLMLHGVDGAFAWQRLIHDNSEAASLTMQTADTSLTAFGSCMK
jgi:hypothetical protein